MPTPETRHQGREDDGWKRRFDARVAALESLLGPSADTIDMAVIRFYLGGTCDVLRFPSFVPGMTYVTANLTDEECDQRPNSLGNYELVACAKSESAGISGLISKLARYTCDAKLDVGHTLDLGSFFGKDTLTALLFGHLSETPTTFQLDGRDCGLLLCMGITAPELALARKEGAAKLLERLKQERVFPYTIPGRSSTVRPSRWWMRPG